MCVCVCVCMRAHSVYYNHPEYLHNLHNIIMYHKNYIRRNIDLHVTRFNNVIIMIILTIITTHLNVIT